MKVTLSVFFALGFGLLSFSQIQGPRLSPQAKVEQKIGLTDVKIEYYRPSKSGRVVFGDVVPFNEIWRTGANENTKFTSSDAIVFGKDTLKAGTYAIYTKPSEKSWEIYFYSDYSNWGTPDEWDDAKVVLKIAAAVSSSADVIETFTMGIDNITTSTATLLFSWDKTRVSVPFSVPTKSKMQASIDKTLAGPAANDYYAAADYYFNAKLDMKQALVWIDKYISMKGSDTPYYVYRKKALIQAELKDYKGAIETAKMSSESAEKAGNKEYIEMNKKSIEEWSKKK
jgi:hypothetical protein